MSSRTRASGEEAACDSSVEFKVVVVAVEATESLRTRAESGRKALAKNCPTRVRGRACGSISSSSGSGSGSTVDFQSMRSHLLIDYINMR